mgnify:CR=1 FL=1
MRDFGGEFGGVVDIVAPRLDLDNMQLVPAAVCKYATRGRCWSNSAIRVALRDPTQPWNNLSSKRAGGHLHKLGLVLPRLNYTCLFSRLTSRPSVAIAVYHNVLITG